MTPMKIRSIKIKRAPVALVGAIAGLAGVVGFHSATRAPGLAGSPAPASGSGGGLGSKGTVSTPASGGGTNPSQGQAGGSQAGGSQAGGSQAAPQSAIGAKEQYGYGLLAVKVTVAGNRITQVSVPTIQVADSYSGSIAQQVIPMLRSQVLSLQSARINGVSGATYTSEAYAMSLQSALNKLHFK